MALLTLLYTRYAGRVERIKQNDLVLVRELLRCDWCFGHFLEEETVHVMRGRQTRPGVTRRQYNVCVDCSTRDTGPQPSESIG
jgi:hypothetical protein